jgi:sugar phosphate isomerase/epimerase
MIELCASSLIYAGYSLETALAEIARAGFRAVDLWAVPRLCVHVDPLQDDAERVRRLLDNFGLRPAALSLYGSDVTRALAGIDFAAALGASVVVTGAGVRSLDEAVEYLKPLIRRAEARQVVVAPENHVNSPLEFLAEMNGLFDALDDRRGHSLGITYAPPHSFACGEEPDKVILALGQKVAFFYPWDVPRGYRRGSRESFWSNPDGQLPGSGCLDFARMFASLRDVSYSGFASVVWHGARDWELPRITTALREASDFLLNHIH